ncbi:hypothetical protein BpHYR1_051414 [Brachionus plicatilis]|uniref:Uncharacterized protein n=1 Tax=Brachionus plicatilis TaxID=10195 RepID=A0A3M7S260_BRAPC|nr:hypothetical protein BpHYR1_051414 [Brachionus plicatilis]
MNLKKDLKSQKEDDFITNINLFKETILIRPPIWKVGVRSYKRKKNEFEKRSYFRLIVSNSKSCNSCLYIESILVDKLFKTSTNNMTFELKIQHEFFLRENLATK